jgi:hypothetical protein
MTSTNLSKLFHESFQNNLIVLERDTGSIPNADTYDFYTNHGTRTQETKWHTISFSAKYIALIKINSRFLDPYLHGTAFFMRVGVSNEYIEA